MTTCIKGVDGDAGDAQDAANLMAEGRPKEFEHFPEAARSICLTALTIAAEGAKADIVKPLRGLGSGVFEIALAFKGDAFRVVYTLQLADEIWVVHAFQKKSTKGIKTPKHEIDLIKDRLKRLKEMLG
jgi:phage-related protein